MRLLAAGISVLLLLAPLACADDAADVAAFQANFASGLSAFDKKDYEQAKKRFLACRKKLEEPSVSARLERTAGRDVEIFLAMALARTGELEPAQAALERSAELGWHEPKPVENEPAFAKLKARNDARWAKVVERVRFNERAYAEFFSRLEQLAAEANAALKKGDAAAALKGTVEALRRIKNTKFAVSAAFESEVEYDRACALALTGRKAPAFEAFARALELGFCQWEQVARDPGLAPIRGEPGFEKTVADAIHKETEALHALVAVAHDASRTGDKDAELRAWRRVFGQIDRRRSYRGLEASDVRDWWFDYACALAACGRKQEALKALSIAIESGMKEKKRIDEAKAFDALREDPAFKKIVEPLAAKPPEEPKPEKKPEDPKQPEKPAEQLSLEALEVKEALAKEPLFPLELDAKAMTGEPIKLADLRGKVVLLVYFHSAPPPSIARVLDAWKDKGLAVVGLIPCTAGSTAEAEEILAEVTAGQRIDYPVIALLTELPAAKPVEADPTRTTLVFTDRKGQPRLKKDAESGQEGVEALVKAMIEATK